MCSERWLATRKCRLIWSYGCGHRHQHHISWSRGRESMMNVRRRGSSRALADWKVAQDKEGKNGQRGFGAWLSKDAADERVVWCVCVCLQRNVAWEGKQKRERKAAVGRGQQRKMRELRTKEQREWEQIEAAFQRCCMLSPALPLSNPHDLASNGSRGDHLIGWMSPWSQSPCRLFSPPHRTSFNLLSSNSITQSHYVRWLPGE